MADFHNLSDKLRFLFVDGCSCIICDDEIDGSSPYGLCADCEEKLMRIEDNYCLRCGKPMANDSKYCIACQNTQRHFEFARSALVYTGETANLLRKLKFGNKRYLARYLAPYITDTIRRHNIIYDALIPVPLSKERMKTRKYNQVTEMLKHTGLDNIIYDCAVKIKDNPSQSAMGGRQRAENVKGVYEIRNNALIRGKRILIADDIITTGSTVNELAKILLKAGAASVCAVSVANAEYKLPSESKHESAFETLDLSALNFSDD